MANSRLPGSVSALIDWKGIRAAFEGLPGYTAGDEAVPALSEGQQQVKVAYDEAAKLLREGAKQSETWKSRWFAVGILCALATLACAIIGAAVNNAWSGVGGVVLGQSAVVGCCFKFLNYLRGSDAIYQSLARSKAGFLLCRTDDQYNMMLSCFIDEINRFQSG